MTATRVFIFTAASVFFLAFLALDVLHKAFEQYKLRYVTKSMNDLSGMFLCIEPRQIILLNVAAMAALAALGYLAGGPFFSALGAGRLTCSPVRPRGTSGVRCPAIWARFSRPSPQSSASGSGWEETSAHGQAPSRCRGAALPAWPCSAVCS